MTLSPCDPPLLARSGHAQTLWGHLLPSPVLGKEGTRVEVQLPDGDVMAGSFFSGRGGEVVYIFHGLGGTLDADYMHRTALVCQSLGHSVYLMNHRGAGRDDKPSFKPYHSG